MYRKVGDTEVVIEEGQKSAWRGERGLWGPGRGKGMGCSEMVGSVRRSLEARSKAEVAQGEGEEDWRPLQHLGPQRAGELGPAVLASVSIEGRAQRARRERLHPLGPLFASN